ncbi:tRNA pseudouridine synthase A isoform X2 [Ricinus communis]|uniref:tRNA pseudouridine synthase A isoform X2 n=1 Tax=Ricinus communis TaxID=3988 RepID=UPI000772B70C|nr:tRNA pseudouridine synthase A isoform X2 [Ricinus communis]|eukprot:XP_015577862.1 uncharacterized protein LOC8274808 isoform X2 [Ricinus communis]
MHKQPGKLKLITAVGDSAYYLLESFQFMYARPWQEVSDFYSNVVNGRLSFLELFRSQMHFVRDDAKIQEDSNKTELEHFSNEDRFGRWARVNFKIDLSYHGGSFDGWQKQPGLNTVQGLVEKSLGKFVDEKKAQQLKEACKPLEGCAVVAGRTDKGVSALRQVCSFYTWRKDVRPHEIEDAINSSAPGKIRVISVSEVSRVFHPNFSAKWRRYLYIFPINDGEDSEQSFDSEDLENLRSYEKYDEQRNGCAELTSEEHVEELITSDKDELEGAKKPRIFSICRVNQLLQQLEGKLLSYKIFARDTKASRNVGPPTECFIYHARATEARLPCPDHGEGRKVMCVELVANRFLRKMVRVLVATSIREAAAGAEDDALLKLMDASCRRASAPPAPPDGLCLFDVGYTEFDAQICIVP